MTHNQLGLELYTSLLAIYMERVSNNAHITYILNFFLLEKTHKPKFFLFSGHLIKQPATPCCFALRNWGKIK
jgi:hypothetical protein